MRSDRSASSRAFAVPTVRGRRKLDPASGIRPIFTKAMVKDAWSEAIRKSQARARELPAPATTPLMAATTGFGVSARSGMTRL
jgi:hypothetical protein